MAPAVTSPAGPPIEATTRTTATPRPRARSVLAALPAERLEAEVSTARTQVCVARAMVDHPVLEAAMACGDVSYAKARDLVPHLSGANAVALVDLAERNPAGRLGAAIAAWAQRHEDPDAIRARQHQARSASWRTEPDGTVLLTARLPPEAAGAVCAVIDLADRCQPSSALPTRRQRRVLDERQEQCQHPAAPPECSCSTTTSSRTPSAGPR